VRKTFFLIAIFFLLLFVALFLFLPDSLEPQLKMKFIFKIRLPEVLAAVITGMALGFSGLALQTVLRNDLADPYVLGISGGSCLGVTLSILFFGISGSGFVFRTASSLIFGILSLFLIMKISGSSPEKLLLLGVLSNIFFATLARALTLSLKPSEITSINHFLLGFISPLSFYEILFSLVLFFILLIPLFYMGNEIDILSFSDDESKTIGVNVKKTRILTILIASVLSSLVVSIAGMIGFVGLMVPHISRFFSTNDFKKLFISSALIGPSIILFAYAFTKAVNLKVVIPIGLYINLFGALFFIYLFVRKGFSNDA